MYGLPFDSSAGHLTVPDSLVFQAVAGRQARMVVVRQWAHGQRSTKKSHFTNQITRFFLAGIALIRPLGHWRTHSDTAVVSRLFLLSFSSVSPSHRPENNEGLGEDTNAFLVQATRFERLYPSFFFFISSL